MAKDKRNVKDLAKGILEEATKIGLDSDSSFLTSYHLLEVQIEMLDALEKSFREDGATTTKEYVKGRTNIYTNPAIAEYNKTATAANGTVSTLMKILTTFAEAEGVESGDLMQEFLSL